MSCLLECPEAVYWHTPHFPGVPWSKNGTAAAIILPPPQAGEEVLRMRFTKSRTSRNHAVLPTPQKNGSGPLTMPVTFLRQA
jgi:hypothetical protein